MKKIFIALFAIFNLLSQNSFSETSLMDMALETKMSDEFFSYDLGTNVEISTKENLNVEYYLKLDWYKNYTTTLPYDKYDYCEKIEFSYFFDKLLYYSIYCCSDRIDVTKEFEEKFQIYADKTFEKDGYYIWKDDKTYIIYDIEKNIVTVAKNEESFFNRAVHEKANYSPFYKNGEFNSVYKKHELDDFVFFEVTYNFFKPYVKSETTYNKFKYVTTTFVQKIDIISNSKMECESSEHGLFCHKVLENSYEVSAEIEYVFYNDLLLFYNVFVEDYGREFVKEFSKRFDGIFVENNKYSFGIWENNEVKIVANSNGDKFGVITIYDKNRFKRICEYIEKTNFAGLPKYSMIKYKSNF